MKNCILVIAIFCSLCRCNSLKYLNEKKLNRFILVNGLQSKNGYWIVSMDTSSVLIVKYKKGQRQGKAKIIYNNGGYCILFYKDNLKQGSAKYYNGDGDLYMAQTFQSGTKLSEQIYSPRWQ